MNDNSPLSGYVAITRQTKRAVFAKVDNTFVVWIRDFGTNKIQYTCSCHLWDTEITEGHSPFCSHFFAVIAKLKIDGKISDDQLAKLTKNEISELQKITQIVANFKQEHASENLRLLKQGKISLCSYCKTLPLNNLVFDPRVSSTLHISKIEHTSHGFVVRGRGACTRCGQLISIVNRIPIELSLACPNCGKENFKVCLNEAKDMGNFWTFSVQLVCKNKKCNWERKLSSGGRTITDLLRNIKKVKISPKGIEIENKE
jgi:predicted RNA-binding Zn-ribbon protein involved in translation (DUF1610 family)